MRVEVVCSALALRRGLRGEGGERDIVLTVALLLYYIQRWRGGLDVQLLLCLFDDTCVLVVRVGGGALKGRLELLVAVEER